MLEIDLTIDEEDFTELDLTSKGKVKEAKNTKIALIDADTAIFIACLNSEEETEVLAEEFYTADEYEEITSSKQYVVDTGMLWVPNIDDALRLARGNIQDILDATGCASAELHFSGGRENFRYDVSPIYKANRTQRTPAGISEVKKLISEEFESYTHTKWEADDTYVFKLQRDFNLRNAEREELKLLAESRYLGDTKVSSGHHSSLTGKTKVYAQWDNMLDRCYGTYKDSIANYQDNKIKVYSPWVEDPDSYITWALSNGWFDGCSIDRIDYLGHYIPSNIQFITKSINTIKQNLIDNPKTDYDFKTLIRLREERLTGDTWKTILGEDFTENLRSALTKQIKNIEGFNTQLDYLSSRLGDRAKFKLNNTFYLIRNGKAETYRDYIGCSIDKDCLYSVETNDICRQFNYHYMNFKFVDIAKFDTIKWRYLQTIMGDTVDNIIGLKGIGPVKANTALENCFTHKEMWAAVVIAYKNKSRTKEDALMNLNLVDMKLLHEIDGELKIVLRTHEEMEDDN